MANKKKSSKAKKNVQRPAPRSSGRASSRPTAPDFDLAKLSLKPGAIVEAAPVEVEPASVEEPPRGTDSLAPYVSEPALAVAAPVAEERADFVKIPSIDDTLKGGLFAAKRAAAHTELDEDEAFFAGAERATAELHAEEMRAARAADLALEVEAPIVAPHVVARRNVLRRAVSTLVGAAAVFAIVAGARVTMAKGNASSTMTTATATNHTTRAAVSQAMIDVQAAAQEKADDAARAKVAAEAAKAAAEPEVTPVVAAVAEDEAAKPTLDPEAAKALTKKSLAALERGNYKVAIENAEASVAADPTDANAYMYWGTALMETGKRADAKQIFGRCVAEATRGPKADCKQWK